MGAVGRKRSFAWRALLSIATVLAFVLVPVPHAEAFVYWANFTSGTIGRANLDGTGVDQNFITGADNPVGVAVDASHVYWANEGFLLGTTIGRANLDGTVVDQNFITGANAPAGVAVDGSHVYWANELGDSIGRANLDGTGVDQNFITSKTPCGPAVDSSHVYWATEFGGKIGRASLDGANVNRRLIDAGFGACPVALDRKHLYWAQITSIGRAKLNGDRVDRRFIASQDLTTGVAVDAAHIYWTNFDGTIGRANLAGTGKNHSFICGANHPFGVAVDALSAPSPQPPSSEISFCTVTNNKRKGTAQLTVNVAGPGELELAKTRQVKGAQATAQAGGAQKLPVEPRGKAKKKLNKKGRATVKVEVTYTPTGGSSQTASKKIRLVKRR